MTYNCPYCDPKYYIIDGFCSNCKRRCEPPLFDPNGNMNLFDYEEFKKKWNQERADAILDEMRRKDSE